MATFEDFQKFDVLVGKNILSVHKKIIQEVIEEKKKDPKVVSILLYGSIARGTAHKDSDVDIEIIYDGGKYKDSHEYRYGIKVDFEFWPKKKLLNRIKKYPFLSYPYLEEKILFDQQGIAKEIKQTLTKYFKENPEAKKAWEKWLKEYLELKRKRIQRTDEEKIKSCKDFYDQLEIKFLKEHKVTRDF